MTSACITPTLFLGEPEEAAYLHDVEVVETAEQAANAVLLGLTALLPAGAWDKAEQTLRLLGCSPAWIENRITFAMTGQLI